MINVTGTLINLYQVCKRETWLHANGIRMEHTSDVVTEGKLVHETSYPNRAARYEEVRIGGSVIDFYDPKEKVIHEIKKSTSKEEAYIWQVKYYLLLFEREGNTQFYHTQNGTDMSELNTDNRYNEYTYDFYVGFSKNMGDRKSVV